MDTNALKQKMKRIAPRVTDVVGIELGTNDSRGCPAVRLTRKGTTISVVAVGFIPDVGQTLPKSWEEASAAVSWNIKGCFQASHAAFAVNSDQMFLRLLAQSAVDDSDDAHAEAGIRKVSQVVNQEQVRLEAGLPEFQVLWLSRLLPEGRRPTACSVQVAPSAALNAILSQPKFVEAGGTACVLYVFKQMTVLVAYQGKALMLYREYPLGYQQIAEAMTRQLGLDASLVDEMLDDTVIDVMPVLEPLLKPLFRQVEISADYLQRRHQCQLSQFFVCGLPAGAGYWAQLFQTILGRTLLCEPLFGGLTVAPHHATDIVETVRSQEQVWLAAYGAARAVLEDE